MIPGPFDADAPFCDRGNGRIRVPRERAQGAGVQAGMTRAVVWMLPAIFVAGCSSGQNTECRWPDEARRALDLRVDADAQHLRQDIELAEELAVRFADNSGLGPGPARQQLRVEQCFEPLVAGITSRHALQRADVIAAQSRLGDRGLNLAVNVPVSVLFGVSTLLALRTIRRRFAGERPAMLAATLLSSVVIATMTTGFGRIWQMIAEAIRLGNGHLGGLRGLRLPWVKYSFEYFLLLLGCFLLIAAVDHARRDARAPR